MRSPIHGTSTLRLLFLLLLVSGTLAAQTLWQRRSSPDASQEHTLTYYPPSGAGVLFGGRDQFVYEDRTALFDGTSWTHTIPVGAPAPRHGHATTYDPTRQVLVLFGGSISGSGWSDETWEYDGVRWSRIVTTFQPSAREDHALAFDPNTGKVILFGGSGLTGLQNDTWTWDGDDWIELQATDPTSTAQPPVREEHGMATVASPFPGASRVVLFGGDGWAALPDTWVWNGATWATVGASSPAQRTRHSMVSTGGQVVMFGGDVSGAQTNETWTFNGASWTQLAPGSSPSPRRDAALSFDSTSGDVVLFGGLFNATLRDTWRFDGATWTEVESSPDRREMAMAFHANTGRLVLFGGADSLGLQRDETHLWDGESWTQSTAATPGVRRYHAMAPLPGGDVLMFGGIGFSGLQNDTQIWNGSNWVLQSQTAPIPSVRSSHAVVGIPSGALLFGGSSSSYEDDTWLYDEATATWSELTFAGATPTPREKHAMAYDPVRNEVVLFGGRVAASPDTIGDTWVFDVVAQDWAQRTSAVAPAARKSHSMAWDGDRGVVLLVGGIGAVGQTFSDVHEWDGSQWQLQDARCMDIDRYDAAMAWDPVRAELLLHGGNTNVETLASTWRPMSAAPASFTSVGVGCAVSGGAVPVLQAAAGSLPYAGATFQVQVVGAPPQAFVLPQFSTPLVTPVPLPWPGCELYLSLPAFALPATTTSVINLPLPKAVNHFVGSQFRLQAIVLGSTGDLYFTNAGDLVIGRQ